MELYIDGIYQAIFSEVIETSAKRQDICKVKIKNSENIIRDSSPDSLESNTKWKDWIPALKRFPYVFGVDGFPLSYVICEDEAPYPIIKFQYFIYIKHPVRHLRIL